MGGLAAAVPVAFKGLVVPVAQMELMAAAGLEEAVLVVGEAEPWVVRVPWRQSVAMVAPVETMPQARVSSVALE
jgi:hypothetical protein